MVELAVLDDPGLNPDMEQAKPAPSIMDGKDWRILRRQGGCFLGEGGGNGEEWGLYNSRCRLSSPRHLAHCDWK